MAYMGWLQFGGQEIFNIERTRSYVETMLPGLQITDCYPCNCNNLHEILGVPPYRTPALDNAPWYDPLVPDSHGFIGLYPLEVTGLDDDTREATVTQSTFDGGFIAKPRRATREIRVSGLLIGEDQGSADYGLFWLRQILDSNMRRAKIGRADPAGNETMAGIPDICGEERGTIKFLAACPELGCGQHCGHRVFTDTRYPILLSSLKPTSGTYRIAGTEGIFTPQGFWSELRTPNLPDTETCPVTYVWQVKGEPGALAQVCGVRDGKLRVCSEPQVVYERTNLATNPQFITTAGTAEVRRNLAINPSLRHLDDATTVATNRVGNPQVAATTNGWIIASGTGGAAVLSRQGVGAPLPVAAQYAHLHWNTAQTGTTVMPLLGFGNLAAGFDRMDVVAGERIYGSMWWRCDRDTTTWRLVLRFYNAAAAVVGSINGPTMDTIHTGYTWQQAEASGVVPATATAVRIMMEKVGGPNMGIGDNLDATAAMVIRNQRAIQYFSGATPQRGGMTFGWVGAANASASTAVGTENVFRTNVFPNPALTLNMDGWGSSAGSGDITTLSRQTGPGLTLSGNAIPAYCRIKYGPVFTGTVVGSGFAFGYDPTGNPPLPVPVQAGQPTTYSAYARSSVGGRTARIEVLYWGAGPSPISAQVLGPPATVAGTAWTRLSLTHTPPPGAEHVAVFVNSAGGRLWLSGDTFDCTAVLVEMTDTLQPYFDGATPASTGFDYQWGYPAGRAASVSRARIVGGETVVRTNYALNPLQHAAYPAGIVSNDVAAYPLTQDPTNRTYTTKAAASVPWGITEVTVTGVDDSHVSQVWAAGDNVTFSMDVSSTSTQTLGVSVQVQFRSNTDSFIGAGPNYDFSMAPGQTIRVWGDGLAPAGTQAVYATVSSSLEGAVGTAPLGVKFYYDNVLIDKAPGPRAFFAGSSIGPSASGLDSAWEGAPHKSRSLAVGGKIDTTLAFYPPAPLWQSRAFTPGGGQAGSAFVTDVPAGAVISGQDDTLITAGQFYSASLQIRQVGGVVDPDNRVTITGQNYDASDVAQGLITHTVTDLPVTGSWQLVRLIASTAAIATGSLRPLILRAGTWGDDNARLEVGDIIVERVGAVDVPAGAFFDGNRPTDVLDYSWASTPDASVSVGIGTKVAMTAQSTFPQPYQNSVHALTGRSVTLPVASWIEPTHTGLIPGEPTVIAFDVFKAVGDLTCTLMVDDGITVTAGASFTIVTPADGRASASTIVPADAFNAWWRITNDSGDLAYVSRVTIEAPIGVAGPFFDGSIKPAFWNGTPNASTSTWPVEPIEIILPEGDYNDGKPSFSMVKSEGELTIESVTAFYFTPDPIPVVTAKVQRYFYAATCSDGPTVTQEFSGRSASMRRVEFTLTCPDPWSYGNPIIAANVTTASATYLLPGVTMSTYTPGSVDLDCYAEDIAFVPVDPNCPPVPNPPRPDPVNPCGPHTYNRALLFSVAPTVLEELAATHPKIFVRPTSAVINQMQVRCWPKPTATATLEDISACDTRGWLLVGKITANRGFTLDCAMHRGTLTHVAVTGAYRDFEATHFIYPPIAIPLNPTSDYDQIPLTWPEMYGGNHGYFLLVEYNSTTNLSMDLQLQIRR